MSLRRVVAVSLFAAVLLPQTGCIGSFRLTDKVFQWNRGVGSLVVQEILFLAFVILPVYEITVFIDAFILNVIEAFTGSNPLSATEGPRDVELAQGTVLRMERTGEHALRTTLLHDGRAPEVREFQFRADGVDVRGADGALVASASQNSAGGIELFDAQGDVLASWSPATVREAGAALENGGAPSLARVVGPTVTQAALAAE